MEIDLTLEIEIPMMPNFLRIKDQKTTIDIGALSEEAYEKFEKKYTEKLRHHWEKRKLTI